MIGLVHAHEQMNALVKGDGGAIGLTEDPGALRHWMVAGQQLAMMIEKYQNSIENSQKVKHHSAHGPLPTTCVPSSLLFVSWETRVPGSHQGLVQN